MELQSHKKPGKSSYFFSRVNFLFVHLSICRKNIPSSLKSGLGQHSEKTFFSSMYWASVNSPSYVGPLSLCRIGNRSEKHHEFKPAHFVYPSNRVVKAHQANAERMQVAFCAARNRSRWKADETRGEVSSAHREDEPSDRQGDRSKVKTQMEEREERKTEDAKLNAEEVLFSMTTGRILGATQLGSAAIGTGD